VVEIRGERDLYGRTHEMHYAGAVMRYDALPENFRGHVAQAPPERVVRFAIFDATPLELEAEVSPGLVVHGERYAYLFSLSPASPGTKAIAAVGQHEQQRDPAGQPLRYIMERSGMRVTKNYSGQNILIKIAD